MNSRSHLRGLNPYLRSRIIGQDEAIVIVSDALVAAECNLNECGPRPRCSFLLMGPSGVGKTETTKVFTEYLFGHDQIEMLFMNEMESADDVGKLFRQIQRGVQEHPEGTTLLFDEIEKAHRAVIDVFISLIDEGQATGADGERISVANCYLVMTSNIGAKHWEDMEETLYSTMETFAFNQAKKVLRPELFRRLTNRIVFRPLSQETQIAIIKQVLDMKFAHIEPQFGKLTIEPKKVNAHLLRKCFTQGGGARELKQILDGEINIALLPWALDEKRPDEGLIYFNPKKDCLELR